MKKLVLADEIVKRVEATCDWCGESKTCYQCTQSLEVTYIEPTKHHWKRMKEVLWNAESKYYWVADGDDYWEQSRKEIDTHICADCARQIGNFERVQTKPKKRAKKK